LIFVFILSDWTLSYGSCLMVKLVLPYSAFEWLLLLRVEFLEEAWRGLKVGWRLLGAMHLNYYQFGDYYQLLPITYIVFFLYWSSQAGNVVNTFQLARCCWNIAIKGLLLVSIIGGWYSFVTINHSLVTISIIN
jgi:hypothetical protein